jgi:glucose/arabinose dehydrogenase
MPSGFIENVIARWLIGVVCVLLAATPAAAQLRAELFASGFSAPIAFVQDPSQANVHVVVQQNGLVFAIVDGVVAGTFLDLTAQTNGTGESGLLGFAFAPDYATSRRFFVNFTNLNGDTVVARFERMANDPLQADPSSRFDLVWPGGLPFIDQPFGNHNGGHLLFGPDGYLYIGLGDGGSGDDPFHLAQNPLSLLGKMLRLDVSVPDNDAEGYDVPADNPFIGAAGVLPEIWAFGLRNPWRYSFDNPARGGTGALIIGDVGQAKWEEIDYEPAGASGRNYGWRNREGAHDNVTSLPPFSQPLIDPIFEYDHDTGHSITGGIVYRGSALAPTYTGRYFFADFSNSRIWSAGLSIHPLTGEATVTDVVEHTAELGAAAILPSSFGMGADGEIFVVSYAGAIYRIATGLVTNGNFSSGMSGWNVFATPDPSYLVGGLSGGVFEFFRQPPPPGTSNQAVVFQNTGVALPAGATLAARFDIGNSSNVRKRLSVLLTDQDFSDLFVCTFWLEPGAPLRTYQMHTHTTEPWDSASVAFYAATSGSQGGFYQLDNVSVRLDPGGSPERTLCIDPLAPAPPGGPAEPTLLFNGNFGAGLGPWVLFGQIVAQVANGVFEFHRGSGTPAGVVLQETNQPMAAQQILSATFSLGNSSGIRQRVTVLLHDIDFSDLAACTFWLPPGSPLMPYTMQTYTTEAWGDATLSVYPASVTAAPWLQLDDVSFQRTPSVATSGTDCLEPGGGINGDLSLSFPAPDWRSPGRGWRRADPEPDALQRYRDAATLRRRLPPWRP